MRTINLVLIFIGILITTISFGQQDEQSSMYMFNPLQFNPAYAGSRGALTGTAVMRAQWVGVKGAPMTQFVSLHGPMAYNPLGFGLHISNDRAGEIYKTAVYGDMAYSLKLSRKGHRLNFGASAGMDFLNLNFGNLVANEPDVNKIKNISLNNFNFGLGAYYYSKRFYAGFSVPRFNSTDWDGVNLTAKHYFFAMGYVHPLNSVIDLKTSTLVKFTQNAPLTVDVNANLFFYKTFWIGGMYRYNESAGLNIAFQIKEQWMFGYSYDFIYNGLSRSGTMGTHEVMLTYDMNGKRVTYTSPRYF
jgi:type IX secretion system PorP/SprF family membrane protein